MTSPQIPVPIYVAAAGPQVAKYAGRIADGFICTSGKGWKLYTETLLPNVAEGIALAGKPTPDYDRHDRDEGLLRHRPPARPGRHPPLGRAGADAGGKDVGRGSQRNGTPGRRAAGGARRQPLDRLHRSRTSTSRRSARTSSSASATWCSTPPARTRHGSSSSMASRCCRSCAALRCSGGKRRSFRHRPIDAERRRVAAVRAPPACRWSGPATIWPRSSSRRWRDGGLCATATSWWWRRRSSPRPRAASSTLRR